MGRPRIHTKPVSRLELPSFSFDAAALGRAVAIRRQELGSSLKFVGGIAGVSPTTVLSLEQGDLGVRFDNLLRIADALRLDPSALIQACVCDAISEHVTSAPQSGAVSKQIRESRIVSKIGSAEDLRAKVKQTRSDPMLLVLYILALADGRTVHRARLTTETEKHVHLKKKGLGSICSALAGSGLISANGAYHYYSGSVEAGDAASIVGEALARREIPYPSKKDVDAIVGPFTEARKG